MDGKSQRGSRHSNPGIYPLHLVSSRASQKGLTLAEVPRDQKSIEITSISVLFGLTTFQKTIKTLAGLETQQNKGLRHRKSSPLFSTSG